MLLYFILKQFIQDHLTYDDAYMFIRYAQQLKAHHTYGWNAGEPAFGCTSILYTFWVSLSLELSTFIHLSQQKILIISSGFWALLLVPLMYHILVKDLDAARGFSQESAFIILGTLLFAPVFLLNAVTGMDTSMSMFINTALIWSAFNWRRNRSYISLSWMILIAYLSFLGRPDNGVYMLIFPALFFWIHQAKKHAYFFFYGLLFMALLADSLIKYQYFGYILPLPAYVKSGDFYTGYLGIKDWSPLKYMAVWIGGACGGIVLMGLLLVKDQGIKLLLPFLLPLILTVIYLFNTVQIMGAFARFYVPSTPFLIIGIWYALSNSDIDGLHEYWKKRIWISLMVLGAGIFIGFYGDIQWGNFLLKRELREANNFPLEWEVERGHDPCNAIGGWEVFLFINDMLDQMPDDVVFASTEHGYIASSNPRKYILDLSGLHNRKLAMGNWSSELLLQPVPDIIWMPHWHYSALHYKLREDAFFTSNYDYNPYLFGHGFAVRKGFAHRDIVDTALDQLECPL